MERISSEWTVGDYTFMTTHGITKVDLELFTYAICGKRSQRYFNTLEEAMAEAIAEALTGTAPQAAAPGVGSAAAWFIAACKGSRD